MNALDFLLLCVGQHFTRKGLDDHLVGKAIESAFRQFVGELLVYHGAAQVELPA